jgi:uncharacterized membrane protein
MYCNNCHCPVTKQDQYCPKCSEFLTDFTTIDSLDRVIKPEANKIDNEIISSSKNKISRKGKQLIGIGLLFVLFQIISYLGSYEVKFGLSGPSGIGYFLGRNILLIVGLVLLIRGAGMKE